MIVVVDTTIWSLGLRRKRSALSAPQLALVGEWERLVRTKSILLIGLVRQELLSGLRDPRQFARLRDALRAFPDEQLELVDFEVAAELANVCHAGGIAPATVDMLICATAIRRKAAIFTTDADFPRYATRIPIQLHRPE